MLSLIFATILASGCLASVFDAERTLDASFNADRKLVVAASSDRLSAVALATPCWCKVTNVTDDDDGKDTVVCHRADGKYIRNVVDPDCSFIRSFADFCDNASGVVFSSACNFAQQKCASLHTGLVDYTAFIYCTCRGYAAVAYVALVLWLGLLVSLLATTADRHFVPPLTSMSGILKLSPAVAGITLLALGNGAPDVFTAYVALTENKDLDLVLGELLGASMFIGTLVLGSVLIVANLRSSLSAADFYRDTTTYIGLVASVVLICMDGHVSLVESALLLGIYGLYIFAVVIVARLRQPGKRHLLARRQVQVLAVGERSPLLGVKNGRSTLSRRPSDSSLVGNDAPTNSSDTSSTASFKSCEDEPVGVDVSKLADHDSALDAYFPGVVWNRHASMLAKIQFVCEFPISLLRVISIPSLDSETWGPRHRVAACIWPLPFVCLMLIALRKMNAFTGNVDNLPVLALPFLLGLPVTAVVAASSNAREPPTYAVVLMLMAFLSSVIWLNIIAGELVSVLETFGLAFGIDSSLLGITVLAMGNSVGDWVADMAVARAGCPQMGVASCFGSPLLNIVLGLGIASTTYVVKHGTYRVDTNSRNFVKVKLSWIFLAGALMMHMVVFPVCKFRPPRLYGWVCIAVYIVYILFSVLQSVGSFPNF